MFLPAREIVGHFAELITQPHSAQPFAGLAAPLAVAEAGQKIRAHLHVLLGGEATQQVVTLKNHADALAQTPPLAATSLG